MVKAPAPYSDDELLAIAAHCTERENAARKVERTMRKVAAAVLLSSRIGETFDAIVTGAADKGTFARLFRPPAEGRIVKGEHGRDVGDLVKVKLVDTEPTRGFIDLVAVAAAIAVISTLARVDNSIWKPASTRRDDREAYSSTHWMRERGTARQ